MKIFTNLQFFVNEVLIIVHFEENVRNFLQKQPIYLDFLTILKQIKI